MAMYATLPASKMLGASSLPQRACMPFKRTLLAPGRHRPRLQTASTAASSPLDPINSSSTEPTVMPAPAPPASAEASAASASSSAVDAAASASAAAASAATAAVAAAGSAAAPAPAADKPKGVLQRIKHFFAGDKMDKERLASLGMGAFASYGAISNITYCTCLTIAWIAFVKATGKSPLAPGEWKGFLAYYAGLWTMQNFVRPLRFSLALALAPFFDRAITWIAGKTKLDKKYAFGILLVGIALTTLSGLGAALVLLGGFPPVQQ